MARMFPNRLDDATESYAERALYEAFRDRLPDEVTVFHGARWLVRDRRRARDGESDFVIVDPARGVLVLEVKGGVIHYDGEAGAWTSNGISIQDPFAQAQRGVYSLIAKMGEMPAWPRGRPYVCHAVVLPDVVVDADLRPDAPAAIILDARAAEDPAPWLAAVYDYYGQGAPLGPADVAALIDLLAPTRALRLPLAQSIRREGERMVELTGRQYMLLDMLRNQRRVAISGCAGTGKTMLAVEQARRLAAQGFAVLLTCYNRDLADYLASDAALPPGVTVANYHHLCRELAERAGLDAEQPAEMAVGDYYTRHLPELLLDAADALGPQYDAVIVDEGQDFAPHYWETLMLLLRDPDEGAFCIFYDDNQNLYNIAFEIPAAFHEYPLDHNCRNTRHIHRAFMPFYQQRDAVEPHAAGPEGRPVEMHYYATEGELRHRLRRVLYRLTVEERVVAGDIVVLTPYRNRGLVHECPRLGNLQLVATPPQKPHEVYCSTIYSYKGLEAAVVILAELQPTGQDLETLVYVGCSRACHHLIILADERLPAEIAARLPAATEGGQGLS
jgi:hypothetical protein